jgi:small conductance mechanosensitive channel
MNYLDELSVTIDKYKTDAINMIPVLLTSIIIFLIFMSIAYYCKSLLFSAVTSENKKHSLIYNQLGYIIYYLIIGAGIITAVTNLGIQSASILTVLGTFGLAIALSLQNTFSNIASGLYIGFNNLYEIGDIIEIDGTIGKVVNFDIFSTTIYKASSKVPVIIPNNIIDKRTITNYTRNDERLLTTRFFVSNANKITFDNIFTTIYDSLQTCKYIINKNNIKIFISDVTATNVTVSITVPINSYDSYEAEENINFIVKNTLITNNII